jgi:Protein of unknown function DUF84
MPTILVASTDPVKIQAALKGFQRMFPAELFSASGVAVPCGVREQPMTSAETLQGAFNRTQNAKVSPQTADYYVGIEGDCEDVDGDQLLGDLVTGLILLQGDGGFRRFEELHWTGSTDLDLPLAPQIDLWLNTLNPTKPMRAQRAVVGLHTHRADGDDML